MAKCIKTQPPPAPVPPAEYVLTLTELEAEVLVAICGAIGGPGPMRDTTNVIYDLLVDRLPQRERIFDVKPWYPELRRGPNAVIAALVE